MDEDKVFCYVLDHQKLALLAVMNDSRNPKSSPVAGDYQTLDSVSQFLPSSLPDDDSAVGTATSDADTSFNDTTAATNFTDDDADDSSRHITTQLQLELTNSCNNRFCSILKRALPLFRCCCCCVYTTHDPYDISSYRQFRPHHDPYPSTTSLFAGSASSRSSRSSLSNLGVSQQLDQLQHLPLPAADAVDAETKRNVRRARWWWRLFFLAYLLDGLLFWSSSVSIFLTVCNNKDITDAIENVSSSSDDDICEIYYWLYIELAPILMLIFAYVTYVCTLWNDMRGDRLVAMLNVLGVTFICVLLGFFGYIDGVMTEDVCDDYEHSSSDTLRQGCETYFGDYSNLTFSAAIFLIFGLICLIHERVIAFEWSYYDFDPRVVWQRLRHFFQTTVAQNSDHAQAVCALFCNWEQFWVKKVFRPFVTMIRHVAFNVCYLDRNNLKLAVFYVWSEIKRNNFSFFIGLSTVLIAVFVAGIMPAVNDKAGIVFLKLAENDVGEADMLFTATFTNADQSLSYINNGTHNLSLTFTYDNAWMSDLNVDAVNALLRAAGGANVSLSDLPAVDLSNLTNIYQILNVSDQDVNLTKVVLNTTGLSYQQLKTLVGAWNNIAGPGASDAAMNVFLANVTTFVNQNLKQLNLSDGQSLEWNVQMSDDFASTSALLNYTYIKEKLEDVSCVSGSAPRWWLLANVTAGKTKNAVSTIVLAIESEWEKLNGIGRAWEDVPALEGNEAYIMDAVTRAMNVSTKSAAGTDFLLYATLGGFQDSFDLDFSSLFLDTPYSVSIESELISAGIASSCITLDITPNSRPQDFSWVIYDLDYTPFASGNVSDPSPTCISARATEYIFLMTDAFGDGMCCSDVVQGSYSIYWDGVLALGPVEKFNYNSYDLRTFGRPSDAYGSARIELDAQERVETEEILNFLIGNELTQLAMENVGDVAGIGGIGDISDVADDVEDGAQSALQDLVPALNVTELVLELQNSTYNESVELLFGHLLYYIGFGADMEIERSVASGDGKWSSILGSVVVMDAYELRDLALNQTYAIAREVGEYLSALVGLGYLDSVGAVEYGEYVDYMLGQVSEARLEDYAIQVIMMYKDRLDAYLGSMDDMQAAMVKFSNAVFDALGVDFQATVNLPIYEELEFLIFFKIFLTELLFCCIVLMTTLVLLLTYALLLNDVEERTYTYGMLRALGMKHATLIQIMVLKSVTFSVPATLVSIILCMLANIPIVNMISSYAHIDLSYALPSISLAIGAIVGFVTPMVSIYLPTRRALSKTLRDSLDVYHHVMSDISVSMIKLENLGLSPSVMGVAIILVVIGLVCSVGVPYAIYYFDYDLFFGIFGGILLAMIYGMCLIAAIISIPLSRLLVKIGLRRGPHAKLKDVILKNLQGHANRNVKTSVMFIVCLGFCIFSGCSDAFLASSTVDFLEWFAGSDIEVYTGGIQENALPSDLDDYLDSLKESGKIRDWTKWTFPLSYMDPTVYDVYLSSLAMTPWYSQGVVGVQENFLNVNYNRFVDISSVTSMHGGRSSPTRSNGDVDVIKLLYEDAGKATLPIEKHGINVPPPVLSGRYVVSDALLSSEGSFYKFANMQTETIVNSINESYTDYVDIIISTSLASVLGIDENDPMMMKVTYQNKYGTYSEKYILCKIRAVMNKMPGLVMLPYSLDYASFLASYQNAAITTDAFAKIMAQLEDKSIEDAEKEVIYQTLTVKLPKGSSDKDYDDVKSGIRNYVPNQEVQVLDVHALANETQDNVSLVNDFFLILGAIGLVLSFFILWLSFLSNIRNSSWELGVLRSIGLSKYEVMMIYIYEALAIVISCIVLGTVIGIVTSYMLISQFNLFLMMPVSLGFPWSMYGAIVGIALMVALLGSYLPMRRYINECVAQVLRGS